MLRVIIPSRTDEYLDTVLESLERSQPGSVSRVVVADNGIGDQVRRYWEAQRVTFVRVPVPFVFARAINMGVDATEPADDLLLLNDDTEMLTERWAEVGEKMLERISLRNYGLISLSISKKENVGNHDQALDPMLNPNGGVKESMKTLCFIAVVIRRWMWEKIGRLDESFTGYGFDDNDYCVRVWNSGKRCGIVSSLVVKHGKPEYPFSSSYARYNSMEKLNELWKENAKVIGAKYPGLTK